MCQKVLKFFATKICRHVNQFSKHEQSLFYYFTEIRQVKPFIKFIFSRILVPQFPNKILIRHSNCLQTLIFSITQAQMVVLNCDDIMEDICTYRRHANELLWSICIMIPRITSSVLVHRQAVLVARREFQFPNVVRQWVAEEPEKEKINGICYASNSHGIGD